MSQKIKIIPCKTLGFGFFSFNDKICYVYKLYSDSNVCFHFCNTKIYLDIKINSLIQTQQNQIFSKVAMNCNVTFSQQPSFEFIDYEVNNNVIINCTELQMTT